MNGKMAAPTAGASSGRRPVPILPELAQRVEEISCLAQSLMMFTKRPSPTSGGAPNSEWPAQPFHMVVDRPFFCAIEDGRSGVLLFLGAIYEPEG